MGDQEKRVNISDLLESHRRDREQLLWEGTFREYFELAASSARLGALSHARICEMVLAPGVEKLAEGTRDEVVRYNFFSDELFGIEEPIARIVEYFKSAAQRLEVRKRILLLMGPSAAANQPSSTCSSVVSRPGPGPTTAQSMRFRTARCMKSRST